MLTHDHSNKLFYINGNAETLPFKKTIFDYVIVSFGLRNFNDIPKSLEQIHRVLKKTGVFICVFLIILKRSKFLFLLIFKKKF